MIAWLAEIISSGNYRRFYCFFQRPVFILGLFVCLVLFIQIFKAWFLCIGIVFSCRSHFLIHQLDHGKLVTELRNLPFESVLAMAKLILEEIKKSPDYSLEVRPRLHVGFCRNNIFVLDSRGRLIDWLDVVSYHLVFRMIDRRIDWLIDWTTFCCFIYLTLFYLLTVFQVFDWASALVESHFTEWTIAEDAHETLFELNEIFADQVWNISASFFMILLLRGYSVAHICADSVEILTLVFLFFRLTACSCGKTCRAGRKRWWSRRKPPTPPWRKTSNIGILCWNFDSDFVTFHLFFLSK